MPRWTKKSQLLIFVMQIRPWYLILWWFLYFIKERFNKNAKVEKLTKQVGRSVRLIVKGPYTLYVLYMYLCFQNQQHVQWYQCFRHTFPCSGTKFRYIYIINNQKLLCIHVIVTGILFCHCFTCNVEVHVFKKNVVNKEELCKSHDQKHRYLLYVFTCVISLR